MSLITTLARRRLHFPPCLYIINIHVHEETQHLPATHSTAHPIPARRVCECTKRELHNSCPIYKIMWPNCSINDTDVGPGPLLPFSFASHYSVACAVQL